MRSLSLFAAASLCEIAGCFAFWMFFKLHRPALWLLPGVVSLAVFAMLLSRVESPFAGRAYAAYGGIYILASLVWLILIERSLPDRWDLIGGVICLLGASVILWGPR